MIAAMIAAVSVTIGGLVRIWRSGLFSRGWPWTIGALCGLSTLRMNLGTGEFAYQPISFQLLSASAVQTELSPWILGLSVPLVALIALFRGRRTKEEDAPAEA